MRRIFVIFTAFVVLATGVTYAQAPSPQAFEPEMVRIPAGAFVMGSQAGEQGWNDERPTRTVEVREFEVGKYEVTFDDWGACVSRGGCAANPNPKDYGFGRGRRPVTGVSWSDAQEYVRWLRRATGKEYRLLTEAEWEYAARAGTSAAFHTGPTMAPDQAQYRWTSAYAGSPTLAAAPQGTALAGSFPANAFGLHDMNGNVWEWVQDCYEGSYFDYPSVAAANDPVDCHSGSGRRVLRGGSWSSDPRDLRSAVRKQLSPSNRSNDKGFRVARSIHPLAQ